MRNKVYWGFAALIILLIGAGGFIYWQLSEVQQLKEQLAQDDKMLEQNDKAKVQHAVSKANKKPPDEPGFEWVRHNDHWDKVPISNENEVVERSDVPITEVSFNFSVKLPTDAELPKYSRDTLTMLLHEANSELWNMQQKYVTQSRSLVEAAEGAGIAKMRDLFKQDSELARAYLLLRSERKERIRRIQQYSDTLE